MPGVKERLSPRPVVWLVWLLLFAGLPALVAGWEAQRRPVDAPRPGFVAVRAPQAGAPPPPVEPVAVYALPRDKAQALNSAIPFSHAPNPAARPFLFSGTENDLARAIDCLAAAQIYEAGDDAVGERAVAQVVLNRVRHPAFPKTVCGVVFQGQERRTGCQFTFSCDGALARIPGAAAWERAREIARAALAGNVYAPVGHATHYHTDWVVPYWSDSLDKITAVGTHLFFRWRGWWGTPPAFGRGSGGGEPLIARIAMLSAAHRAVPGAELAGPSAVAAAVAASAELAARPAMAIGANLVGRSVAGSRLIAIAPGDVTYLFELGRGSAADSWPTLAQTVCAGRPLCRIMAWRAGSAPGGWPPSPAQIESMSFGYIHNSGSGLQRALWNCAQTPRAVQAQCMRQRVPVAAVPTMDRQAGGGLAGVRRKDRFETVKIAPVAPVVPPAGTQSETRTETQTP